MCRRVWVGQTERWGVKAHAHDCVNAENIDSCLTRTPNILRMENGLSTRAIWPNPMLAPCNVIQRKDWDTDLLAIRIFQIYTACKARKAGKLVLHMAQLQLPLPRLPVNHMGYLTVRIIYILLLQDLLYGPWPCPHRRETNGHFPDLRSGLGNTGNSYMAGPTAFL